MSDPFIRRQRGIKQVIHDFIAQREQQKIEKMDPDDPKYQQEKEKYQPEVWLEKATQRIGQIQIVTHPLKSTYPNAHIRDGTSLYCHPKDLPNHNWVSTHVLGDGFRDDVTGGAAAFDIFALLQQNYENTTLLQLCLEKDAAFEAALHDDPEIAAQWREALATVKEPKTNGVASHTYAKQMFWLEGNNPYADEEYLIVAPLHSSTLAHAVFTQIDQSRFGEEAKQIRDAIKNNKKHDGVAHYYPNLAVLNIGGSKPQNISALSSARRGNNYLLASLPPQWTATNTYPPLHVESVFKVFGKQKNAICDPNYWLDQLTQFLKTNPPPNQHTRNRVEALMNGLLDELYVFALNYQEQLQPGWSADTNCQLPRAQRCWLDPERALADEEFAQVWLELNWDEQVEKDFARWVNSQLGKQGLALGDVEFRRWAKEMRSQHVWQALISDSKKQMAAQLKGQERDVNNA